MQPVHTILCHLTGWVAFSPSPKPLPKQQLPTPTWHRLQPYSAVGWIVLQLSSPSSSEPPDWLFMLLREEPTCGEQMQQIMASASFHFSSCPLSLSSAFLGCDPHSSWEKVLPFNSSISLGKLNHLRGKLLRTMLNTLDAGHRFNKAMFSCYNAKEKKYEGKGCTSFLQI